MKKLIYIFLLQLLSLGSYSQDKDTSVTKKIKIAVPGNLDSGKQVLLYEADTFKLFSTPDLLIANLKSHIKKYDVEWDKNLLVKLNDSTETIKQRTQNIRASRMLNSRLNYRIEDLILKKKCWVYNKHSGFFEKKLLYTKYIRGSDTGIMISTVSGKK